MTAKTARFPGNAQTSEVRACMRMCTCACTCMQPCLNPTQHTDLPAYEKDSKRMCACISSDAPHGANHCTPKAAAADKVRPAWGHGRSRPLSAPVARPLVCVHVHACMHACMQVKREDLSHNYSLSFARLLSLTQEFWANRSPRTHRGTRLHLMRDSTHPQPPTYTPPRPPPLPPQSTSPRGPPLSTWRERRYYGEPDSMGMLPPSDGLTGAFPPLSPPRPPSLAYSLCRACVRGRGDIMTNPRSRMAPPDRQLGRPLLRLCLALARAKGAHETTACLPGAQFPLLLAPRRSVDS